MKCRNPECGNELHRTALSCSTCGWDTPRGERQQQSTDPFPHRCADVDQQGYRCAAAAALSESTRGGGKWFCASHFPPFRTRGYKSAPPPPGWRTRARTAAVIAEEELERNAIQAENSPT